VVSWIGWLCGGVLVVACRASRLVLLGAGGGCPRGAAWPVLTLDGAMRTWLVVGPVIRLGPAPLHYTLLLGSWSFFLS
jgi:hypothetical protein